MEFLAALWLPILLSAVAVFMISSVFHMAINLHKGDTRGLSNEVEVADALRGGNLDPGARTSSRPSWTVAPSSS